MNTHTPSRQYRISESPPPERTTRRSNSGRFLLRQLSRCRLSGSRKDVTSMDESEAVTVVTSSLSESFRISNKTSKKTSPSTPPKRTDRRRTLKESKTKKTHQNKKSGTSIPQSFRNLMDRDYKSSTDIENENLIKLSTLSSDLERMAQALRKVEDPERLLLKHIKLQSPSNSAA